MCLACEDGETYVRWKESIGEAIRLSGTGVDAMGMGLGTRQA